MAWNSKIIINAAMTIKAVLQFDSDSRKAKKYFKTLRVEAGTKPPFILLEASQPASSQIALSYFLPQFCEIFGATPVAYVTVRQIWKFKIFNKVIHAFSMEKSLGAIKTIHIGPKQALKKISAQSKTILLDSFSDLRSFERLRLKNVLVGDLIYDSYLNETGLPTIELTNKKFQEFALESVSLFESWFEYIESHEIVGICVSHTAYLKSIPARIATSFGIQVFQVNAESVYRITKEFPIAYTDSKLYPEIFNELPLEQQIKGKKIAQERLRKRFNGEIGIDMQYSTASAFHQNSLNTRLLIPKSENRKILIAMHDFYDSPHGYGENFYPDFYVWLNRLGELAASLNYEWYIKTHIDVQGNGREILEDFTSRSKSFSLLPKDTSHYEILEGGIDLALTVFGTIAMEYSALGVTVINASVNNPHSAYSFSITPNSVEKYEELLLNLPSISHSISKDEVYEYYYMHNIYYPQSWIYIDFEKYLIDVGGYRKSMSKDAFNYHLLGMNIFAREVINNAVRAFLNSNDLRLSYKHFKSVTS